MPYIRFPINNFTSDSIIRKQPFLTILYKRSPIDIQQTRKIFVGYIPLAIKQRSEIRENYTIEYLNGMTNLSDQLLYALRTAISIVNHLRIRSVVAHQLAYNNVCPLFE